MQDRVVKKSKDSTLQWGKNVPKAVKRKKNTVELYICNIIRGSLY